jgi:hypothetical protein
VSYLNIVNLDKLFSWWLSHGGGDWFNPTHVTYPDWLSLTVLKSEVKKQIADHLRQKIVEFDSEVFTTAVVHLINYMLSADNQKLIPTALDHLDKVDKHRNQAFIQIYKGILCD